MDSKLPILQHAHVLHTVEAGNGLETVPIHVRIEPTESCNFRCTFCWWHDESRKQTILPVVDMTGKQYLPLERLLGLINELAELGTRAISFTGAGDPLVYPWMEPVLRRIGERGLLCGVTTNLAMPLSDRSIDELSRIVWLRWSMNAGSAETYLRVHHPRSKAHTDPSVFDRVQHNIRRLVLARQNQPRPCRLNASFVVSLDNFMDVLSAVRLARDLGVDSLSFRPDMPLENVKNEQSLTFPPGVLGAIQQGKQRYETQQFKVHVCDERQEDTRKLNDPDLLCFYSNHTSYVAASGDVYPCCYTRYDKAYAIGNILNRTFQEFWSGKSRRENYKNLSFDLCPACPHGPTNRVLQDLYLKRQRFSDLPISEAIDNYFI